MGKHNSRPRDFSTPCPQAPLCVFHFFTALYSGTIAPIVRIGKTSRIDSGNGINPCAL